MRWVTYCGRGRRGRTRGRTGAALLALLNGQLVDCPLGMTKPENVLSLPLPRGRPRSGGAATTPGGSRPGGRPGLSRAPARTPQFS